MIVMTWHAENDSNLISFSPRRSSTARIWRRLRWHLTHLRIQIKKSRRAGRNKWRWASWQILVSSWRVCLTNAELFIPGELRGDMTFFPSCNCLCFTFTASIIEPTRTCTGAFSALVCAVGRLDVTTNSSELLHMSTDTESHAVVSIAVSSLDCRFICPSVRD